MYSIMPSANRVFSSFPIWIHFISFSSLIAMGKTSKTTLNNTGKSGTFVSDFRGNVLSFSLLRIIFAVGLSYTAFIMLTYVPSVPTLWRVSIINGC